MSDDIKHECGLAFIRLRKPFSYYQQQYGSVLFGLNKLYLLMEKQHNRGQDGAGIATVKLNVDAAIALINLCIFFYLYFHLRQGCSRIRDLPIIF